MKAESWHFKLLVIVSFHIQCTGVQSQQPQKNCCHCATAYRQDYKMYKCPYYWCEITGVYAELKTLSIYTCGESYTKIM